MPVDVAWLARSQARQAARLSGSYRVTCCGTRAVYTRRLMPRIDQHPPGSFCWFELATTDQAAAKQFYTRLFGWEVADFPIGPSEQYSIFRRGGRDTAAAYTMRDEQREAEVPPFWMVYVATKNADETAARVKK